MNGVGESFGGEDDFEDFSSMTQKNPTSSTSYFSGGGGGGGHPLIGNMPPGGSGGGGNGGSNNSGSSSGHSPGSGGMHASSQGGGGGGPRPQICCLIDDGNRCHRPAGNASYSKRIQKTVYYKRLKLEIDLMAHHTYICDYHKMIIQNARTRKRESEDEANEGGEDVPEVDLYQLQVNTLRRYKKKFKIPSRPGLNKAQLADILMRHFKTIPITEKETITFFIYMIKSERSKMEKEARAEAEEFSRY